MLRIAFIDDGINPETLAPGITYESFIADETSVYPAPPTHAHSHGSLCYAIFADHTRADYHLIDVKILDSATGTGTYKAFFSALDWCAGQGIHLINMSMGTRQYSDFAPIAERIARLGDTIIVAACSNANTLTFPACLPHVIGVRHCNHESLRGKFAYIHNPYDNINIFTCIDSETVPPANSCAAPFISAHVSNYLADGCKSPAEVKEMLICNAVDIEFAGYHFYKKQLLNWGKMSIPVVLLSGENINYVDRKLQELIQCFVADGYCAVGLTEYKKTDTRRLIFSLNHHNIKNTSLIQLIELYYNFTRPDIMFLHMDEENAFSLPETIRPEAHITPGGELDINSSAQTLFKQIIALAGSDK